MLGRCLLHKHQREQAGLGASHNGNQPSYIANLVIFDHPYHPTRSRWLTAALSDLAEQLMPLIRYQGIRRVALLARPFIYDTRRDDSNHAIHSASVAPLDWKTETLPLLTQQLQGLPKLIVDVHIPKSIKI